MVTKKFTFAGPSTGLTIYCTVQRAKDGNYLDSDFKFRETPTAADQAMTELSCGAVKNQTYQFSEGTYAWEDGVYYVTVYLQAGAGAAFNTDTIIGLASLYLFHDEIIPLPYSLSQEV
jgi:hypothetical protein